MGKSNKSTPTRNQSRRKNKWASNIKIDDTPGEDIDLTCGASDDSWDGLDNDDDNDNWTSAIERMKQSTVRITAAKPKPKGVKEKPRGLRSRRVTAKAKTVKITKAAPVLGPKSTPEPNDKGFRSLWRCNSEEEIKAEHTKWGERFNEKCMKAIAKRRLTDDTRFTLAALVDGSATDVPIMTNNKMLALAWETCHRAIWALTKDDSDIEYALVTFIPGDRGTSLNRSFVRVLRSDSLEVKVVRSMSKDFIGVAEQAMSNSLGHPDGGRHVQDHLHVLIWGPPGTIAKAQAVALKRMAEFPANVTGAPQIDVRKVPNTEVNLARICAYMFKSPHKAMNWNPPKDSKPGHMNQSEKGDRMIRYLRMALIRSMMTIEDVMIAGGAGVTIRKGIIDLLRRTCRSDVPVQNRLLHPDEIGRFCARVSAELRKPWEVPVIARQP